MRFFVDDFLRCALVHVCVRLELEEQVQDVDKKQHNAGSTGDFQYLALCQIC